MKHTRNMSLLFRGLWRMQSHPQQGVIMGALEQWRILFTGETVTLFEG